MSGLSCLDPTQTQRQTQLPFESHEQKRQPKQNSGSRVSPWESDDVTLAGFARLFAAGLPLTWRIYSCSGDYLWLGVGIRLGNGGCYLATNAVAVEVAAGVANEGSC